LLINTGKWRLKGTLDSYSMTSTGQAAAAGTGDLYWWNQSLKGGLGDWALARSAVTFTISFTATGSNPKTTPGTFGSRVNYTPVPPQPLTVPNSAPQPLKG